jgi:hypothetical protein
MNVNGITGSGSLYGLGGVNGQNISSLDSGSQQMPSVQQLLSLLTSKLGLNDNQMADLKNILQKYMNGNSSDQSSQTQEANNQATTKTHHGHHGHRLQMMQQMSNDIKSILTPQQAQTFDQWLQSLSQQGNASSNGNSSNSGSNTGSFNSFIQYSGS